MDKPLLGNCDRHCKPHERGSMILPCENWEPILSSAKDEPDWQSIARDLYNAHNGSAGQWERAMEAYEKAVGK